MPQIQNRRNFLAYSTATIAGSSLMLPGCAAFRSYLVPVLEAVGIEVISKYIVKNFSYKSEGWDAGETLHSNLDGVLANKLNDESVITAFQEAYAARNLMGKLASPVLEVNSECGGLIAFIQKASPKSWLVSGYGGVYNIDEKWVDFLINQNSCDLILNGHTERYVPCWNKDCKLKLSKQRFRYADGTGREIVLYKTYNTSDVEQLAKHNEHTNEYPGCGKINE